MMVSSVAVCTEKINAFFSVRTGTDRIYLSVPICPYGEYRFSPYSPYGQRVQSTLLYRTDSDRQDTADFVSDSETIPDIDIFDT